jgi:2,4-dienoyl-CoA reductase-like NADH-dependent reductase (Old Yellow Enzyme family)
MHLMHVDISGGNDNTGYKESIYIDYAAKIAEEVQVSVILVNENRIPKVMEAILNSTQIEYFALYRPLLRQPDLVNIWEKDAEHISKCINCNKCFDLNGNSCVFNK